MTMKRAIIRNVSALFAYKSGNIKSYYCDSHQKFNQRYCSSCDLMEENNFAKNLVVHCDSYNRTKCMNT